MKSLITIIIPMYNSELYIEKLLNCLENQTYKNLEIIIINDGSTDNSLEIVQNYEKQDSRIKVISTENKGVSNARNLGIENSTGDYITFLDSDDYIENDMYEKIMQKLEETNVEALRCNYIKEDSNGNVLMEGNLQDVSNKKLEGEEISNKLFPYIFQDKIPTYMPLLIIKKDLIKGKLNFNTNIYMMEDLLFCLNLYMKLNSIYLYDYKCYHYVINNMSITKSRANIMRNFYGTVKVVHILEDFFSKSNLAETIFPYLYNVYSTMLVKYLLRTFQIDDEFSIDYSEFLKAVNTDSALEIIKKADFSNLNNEYVKKSAQYLQNNQLDEFYQFAIEIKNVNV